MYSDMATPLYEWFIDGNAWSPAWEFYVTGVLDISYVPLILLYSDDIYNRYAIG